MDGNDIFKQWPLLGNRQPVKEVILGLFGQSSGNVSGIWRNHKTDIEVRPIGAKSIKSQSFERRAWS